jgi:glycosyltransferase involved in cell wall biosynthesis
MNLAIDFREAESSSPTGKGQWTKMFVEELKKRNIKVTLLMGAVSGERLAESKSVEMLHAPRLAGRSLGIGWSTLHAPLWHFWAAYKLLKLKPDYYISPTSYIVPALIGRMVPCIVIVHDLIAFRDEPHNRKAKIIERLTLKHAVKNAHCICTNSESTKKDLLEKYPFLDEQKVKVIYAGASIRDSGSGSGSGSNIKTILCLGTLCPRKNQLRLIEAFEQIMVRRAHHDIPNVTLSTVEVPTKGDIDIQLILAGGRGWDDDEIVQKAKETEDVEWIGYISDEKYSELLSQATIFALPSLYEGFGLPILDAMRAGVPVLTSDRGSLKEVAGDAAQFCDPESVESIGQSLTTLLQNDSLRQNLVSKGHIQAEKFNWRRTVDLFLEACR